jgi:hypothetical protein
MTKLLISALAQLSQEHSRGLGGSADCDTASEHRKNI